jgi:hypothetical protein
MINTKKTLQNILETIDLVEIDEKNIEQDIVYWIKLYSIMIISFRKIYENADIFDDVNLYMVLYKKTCFLEGFIRENLKNKLNEPYGQKVERYLA